MVFDTSQFDSQNWLPERDFLPKGCLLYFLRYRQFTNSEACAKILCSESVNGARNARKSS